MTKTLEHYTRYNGIVEDKIIDKPNWSNSCNQHHLVELKAWDGVGVITFDDLVDHEITEQSCGLAQIGYAQMSSNSMWLCYIDL